MKIGKKKKKKKKRVENRGWLQPLPWPKWGGPTTPFSTVGLGWSNHLHTQGGGPATPKRQKKKT
jgi:hypothetical protein